MMRESPWSRFSWSQLDETHGSCGAAKCYYTQPGQSFGWLVAPEAVRSNATISGWSAGARAWSWNRAWEFALDLHARYGVNHPMLARAAAQHRPEGRRGGAAERESHAIGATDAHEQQVYRRQSARAASGCLPVAFVPHGGMRTRTQGVAVRRASTQLPRPRAGQGELRD